MPPVLGGNKLSEILDTMVSSSVVFSYFNLESHWSWEQFAYNEISADTSLNNTPHLQAFMNQQQGGNLEKYLLVDKLIAIGQYQQAFQINQTVQPQNIPEQYLKDFNFYFTKRLDNPSLPFTPVEEATLESIANDCPLEGGNSVYQAQAWLMAVGNEAIEFNDTCIESSNSQRHAASRINEREEASNRFVLYPNPNDGVAHLEYTLPPNCTSILEIYNSSGSLLKTVFLPAGSSKTDIDESNW
jgi:hypothetical protein